MGVQGGVIQKLGLEVTVYACNSDHIVFQLLQGISCLPPLDSPAGKRSRCGPEHSVDGDADTEGVKQSVPPRRFVPEVSGSVGVHKEGREDVQPA